MWGIPYERRSSGLWRCSRARQRRQSGGTEHRRRHGADRRGGDLFRRTVECRARSLRGNQGGDKMTVDLLDAAASGMDAQRSAWRHETLPPPRLRGPTASIHAINSAQPPWQKFSGPARRIAIQCRHDVYPLGAREQGTVDFRGYEGAGGERHP